MKQYLYLLLTGCLIISCKNQNKESIDEGATTADTVSSTTNNVSNTSDPVFVKCWANAFEEEGLDSILIFRPCATHTFPAARYRNTFTLMENGDVEYSVMAEYDAHTTEHGKWTYDAQAKKLNIVNKDNGLVHEYEVIEIADDILRVKE